MQAGRGRGGEGAYLGTQGVRAMNPPQPPDPIGVTYKLSEVDPPPSPQNSRGPCPAMERRGWGGLPLGSPKPS